ncbi:hypothetical protein [Lactobacillus gigeriorum]|uniref:Uncharacterized protein n=1 Tax=Lactobacillus gigeriorum DSM 23908 = CRBIP 24.85 TaxID=1423751 RepID=I7K1V8_9LACO|nr:hypothetical protein [Lactobacillus gigeriorum]KRN14216.1 hypothetical protein FC38_GL001293 [Lactobacillus gigeriorum DSM 23908 = CRBIP 24.85]CCI87675.1 Putative uncharacterized protein [Lactobacillus gigeriorum DSM 23908 = CRBIP 24.85]
MEKKRIRIDADLNQGQLNIQFSDNLNDEKERGYILSAAFFSYAVNQGVTKDQVIEMVNNYYEGLDK